MTARPCWTAGLAVSLLLALAPPALAGQIVFSRGGDVWVMQDDGANPRPIVAKGDTATFIDGSGGTPEQVSDLSRPSVDEPTGTVLFDGYHDSNDDKWCGLRCTAVYKWTGGAPVRMGLDPYTADDFTHFESEAEPLGDGRFVFNNWGCHDGAYITCTVKNEIQSLGDDASDGKLERTALKSERCDDRLGLGDPAPNPRNTSQFVYSCGSRYDPDQGKSVYELIVATGGAEAVVSADDYEQDEPSFRPDGARIVAVEEGEDAGLFELNPAATNDKRRIVAAPANFILSSPRYIGNDTILFEGRTDTDGNESTDASNLYTAPASCTDCPFPGGVRQLTFDGDSGDPAWTARAQVGAPPKDPAKPGPGDPGTGGTGTGTGGTGTGTGTGTTGQTGGKPTTPADTTAPAFTIPAKNKVLTAGKAGVVPFRLGPVAEDATGVISLRTAGKVRAAAKKKVLALGKAAFEAEKGKETVVPIRLTAKARKTLAKRKKLKVKATVILTDAAGNETPKSFAFTLKAPKKRR